MAGINKDMTSKYLEVEEQQITRKSKCIDFYKNYSCKCKRSNFYGQGCKLFILPILMLAIMIVGIYLIIFQNYNKIAVNINNATCEYSNIANTYDNTWDCHINMTYEVKGKIYNKLFRIKKSEDDLTHAHKINLWYNTYDPSKLKYVGRREHSPSLYIFGILMIVIPGATFIGALVVIFNIIE